MMTALAALDSSVHHQERPADDVEALSTHLAVAVGILDELAGGAARLTLIASAARAPHVRCAVLCDGGSDGRKPLAAVARHLDGRHLDGADPHPLHHPGMMSFGTLDGAFPHRARAYSSLDAQCVSIVHGVSPLEAAPFLAWRFRSMVGLHSELDCQKPLAAPIRRG